ncbi:DUF4041 domain-containing protein [Rhodococcoides yunnanense]|uniref:DUF4041 domain-containing protein n=1 Tax=Rhodococcoides yunnanense TaxID=278209 RepID=UPI0012E2DCC7|nr:DUF4041 domain-containing protein [Rhodococcus yunnanensis]
MGVDAPVTPGQTQQKIAECPLFLFSRQKFVSPRRGQWLPPHLNASSGWAPTAAPQRIFGAVEMGIGFQSCPVLVAGDDGLVQLVRIRAARQRLMKAAEQTAKQGQMIDLRVTAGYHRLWLRELELAADVHMKVQEEKAADRE